MDNRLARAVCIMLASASIIFSLGEKPYASIAILFAAAAAYALSGGHRKNATTGEREAAAFIRAVSMAPQSDRQVAGAVKRLSNCAGGFGKELKQGLREYELSGSVEPLPARCKDRDHGLQKAATSIISGALGTGNGIYGPAKEVWEGSKTIIEGMGRRAAAKMGAASVSAMGTALFFPAFSGICTGILMFSGLQGGAASPDIAPLLLFYIAISNAINFKYSNTDPWKEMERPLMAIAAGFAVFGLSLMFSKIMLG